MTPDGVGNVLQAALAPAESSLTFANPGKEALAQATPLDLTNGSEMEDSRRLDGKLIGP